MEEDTFLAQQFEARRRSGRRWARVSLCLGALALLFPILVAGLEQVLLLAKIPIDFVDSVWLCVLCMLFLGIGGVMAGHWAGLRAPKGLRSRRMAVERILGMILGSAAALLIIGFLAVGFWMFGIPA